MNLFNITDHRLFKMNEYQDTIVQWYSDSKDTIDIVLVEIDLLNQTYCQFDIDLMFRDSSWKSYSFPFENKEDYCYSLRIKNINDLEDFTKEHQNVLNISQNIVKNIEGSYIRYISKYNRPPEFRIQVIVNDKIKNALDLLNYPYKDKVLIFDKEFASKYGVVISDDFNKNAFIEIEFNQNLSTEII